MRRNSTKQLQSGFRSNKSCFNALTKITDDITTACNVKLMLHFPYSIFYTLFFRCCGKGMNAFNSLRIYQVSS